VPLAHLIEHDSALGRWRLAQWNTSPPLSGYVAQLWDLESHGAYTRERIIPRTHFDLLINLGDPHRLLSGGRATEYRTAWVSGLQEQFLDVVSPPASRLMGATLTPTGARAVLGVPAGEFTNRVVDLPDVTGSSTVMRLRDQLAAAPGAEDRFRLLESWLLTRVGGGTVTPAVEAALGRVFASSGCARISGIARDLGMSQKHLIHLFHDRVGLPPKTFARIVRFNAVVQHLRTQTRVDWTETAHRFHYFDYAHFARDCRGFTGSSPTGFLRARGPEGDTVVVDA
jgi:AraC-like DNA-binding protein